ncbi:hypothetical protein [Laspinema olomoucense]|uniref:DNA methylase n=1 Tax=Laspinema olomoucense D3b TaxID=2953688 RepID=A0ABT2N3T9_9CYAN|nr:MULTISPECIES: hypothetical protein [unclassified Laspinema]MCT7977322.1 hypothetical protein [Laspinema sp. D3b]MCT7995471.1 hypothetical protein [Laspinema sp. D3c]
MAQSPSHKFGQILGKLLEDIVLYDILKPQLERFTAPKNYYLDYQKSRLARKGKKVTWEDKDGNKHDLDFVIELGGTEEKLGLPLAFIESAWRRYTKHSKNKVQEIQGAILPIVQRYSQLNPFYGVVLAGDFTKPALEQLKNHGFAVIYIPYIDVVNAFKIINFDIAFDETTPDYLYENASEQLRLITDSEKQRLRQALMQVAKKQVEEFMTKLQNCLERHITQIMIMPLFGNRYDFTRPQEAIATLDNLDLENPRGDFQRIEVVIDYNNGDSIRATFQNKLFLADFLKTLGNE